MSVMSITGPLVGMLLVGRNDGFFFVPVFLSFCCYDKIPDKKPLREERIYVSLQFQGSGHCFREVKAGGTSDSYITSVRAERN